MADSRFPTTQPTREEFIDGDRGEYTFALRLTQTASVGEQVEIDDLAAFAEEVRWLVTRDYDLPENYYDVDSHNITFNTSDVRRRRVDEAALEDGVESLAREFDIGLSKNITMSRGTQRSPPTVFVKYMYGWSGTDEEYATDPKCPHARTDWVGGDRGQPETMKPKQITVERVD